MTSWAIFAPVQASAAPPTSTVNLYVYCPSGVLWVAAPSTQGYCGTFAAPRASFSYIEGSYPGPSFTTGSSVTVTIYVVGSGNITSASVVLKDVSTGQTLASGSSTQVSAVSATDCDNAAAAVFTAPATSGLAVSTGDELNESVSVNAGPGTSGVVCSGPSQPTGIQIAAQATTASTNSSSVSSSTTSSSTTSYAYNSTPDCNNLDLTWSPPPPSPGECTPTTRPGYQFSFSGITYQTRPVRTGVAVNVTVDAAGQGPFFIQYSYFVNSKLIFGGTIPPPKGFTGSSGCTNPGVFNTTTEMTAPVTINPGDNLTAEISAYPTNSTAPLVFILCTGYRASLPTTEFEFSGNYTSTYSSTSSTSASSSISSSTSSTSSKSSETSQFSNRSPQTTSITIPSEATSPPSCYNPSATNSCGAHYLYGYSPTVVTVVIGVNNTVAWTNDQGVDHSITSNTGDPASFDSGCIGSSCSPATSDTYTYTFTIPGTYYYEDIHFPWMEGEVNVLSASSSSIPEFPAEPLAITAFAAIIVLAYLALRRPHVAPIVAKPASFLTTSFRA